MDLSGITTILVTPFDDEGSLDLSGLAREVEFLIAAGVKAVGIGLASEVQRLSEVERHQVAETAVRTACGRVPVIGGVGAAGLDLAVQQARNLADLAIDVLMVTPPSADSGEDDIFNYYDAISRVVRRPIVIQDAAAQTGVTMRPALIGRMGREIEHVRFAKLETLPTPQRFEAVRAVAGEDLALLGGAGGRYFLDELRRGAIGTMIGPAQSALYFNGVWDRWSHGDRETAGRIFTRFLPLMHWAALDAHRFIWLEKELLRRWGVISSSRAKAPFRTPDVTAREEIESLLAVCGVVGDRPPRLDTSKRAWRLRIKTGSEEEYDRRHREIWPELVSAMRARGTRNFSIFRDGCDVFLYAEGGTDMLSPEFAMVEVRWHEHMQDILQREIDPRTGRPPLMTEVFHLS